MDRMVERTGPHIITLEPIPVQPGDGQAPIEIPNGTLSANFTVHLNVTETGAYWVKGNQCASLCAYFLLFHEAETNLASPDAHEWEFTIPSSEGLAEEPFVLVGPESYHTMAPPPGTWNAFVSGAGDNIEAHIMVDLVRSAPPEG